MQACINSKYKTAFILSIFATCLPFQAIQAQEQPQYATIEEEAQRCDVPPEYLATETDERLVGDAALGALGEPFSQDGWSCSFFCNDGHLPKLCRKAHEDAKEKADAACQAVGFTEAQVVTTSVRKKSNAGPGGYCWVRDTFQCV